MEKDLKSDSDYLLQGLATEAAERLLADPELGGVSLTFGGVEENPAYYVTRDTDSVTGVFHVFNVGSHSFCVGRKK